MKNMQRSVDFQPHWNKSSIIKISVHASSGGYFQYEYGVC